MPLRYVERGEELGGEKENEKEREREKERENSSIERCPEGNCL